MLEFRIWFITISRFINDVKSCNPVNCVINNHVPYFWHMGAIFSRSTPVHVILQWSISAVPGLSIHSIESTFYT